ncbi:phosphate transporter [Phlyctochytrium bullatum]|nr:phosphate transporter [Phlyctochytrium bullatum]
MIYQVYYGEQITGSFTDPATNITTPYTAQNYKLDFTKLAPENVNIDAIVKASTNWGNLVGQLGFGYLGDLLGRKKMYGIELLIMIICTLGSALSAPPAKGFSILALLGVWRFFLGIGIGGDYPMSAVITSEFANTTHRGMMLAAVFAMQGVGILVGGVVFVVTLLYMKPHIQQDYRNLDYVWRIALGVGIIPALIALYFRLTIPETPRFTVDVVGDAEKATADVEQVLAMNGAGSANVTSKWGVEKAGVAKTVAKKEGFFSYYGKWRNFKVLFGTAYAWFALDIAFYGIQLSTSTILTLINFNGPAKIDGKTPPHDIWDLFYQNAIGNLIIAMAGTFPGYWFTVFLVDKIGRKPIQYLGFGIIAVILLVLAIDWPQLQHNPPLFIALFTVAQFFFQFGPNATTFIVPGEVFPTRFRSTGHGVSAACGKVGAILGVQAVAPLFSENAQVVLGVFAGVMASGCLVTMLLPETKGRTLEELAVEEEQVVTDVEGVVVLDKI